MIARFSSHVVDLLADVDPEETVRMHFPILINPTLT